MKLHLLLAFVLVSASVVLLPATLSAAPPTSGATRQLASASVVNLPSASSQPSVTAPAAVQSRFPRSLRGASAAARVNRSGAVASSSATVANQADVVQSMAESGDLARVKTHFNGLNIVDQVSADGGNQFPLEPPDQGLCVGNGFVVETINTVMEVFDTAGKSLKGPIALNSFYGYPPQLDQQTGLVGPLVTDPSCLFDTATQRWFHGVLTLEADPTTGDPIGPNHIDIAVSQTADPRGAWFIYHVPTQDDGTQGTPDHGCSAHPNPPGAPPDSTPTNPRACLGDFPHIGADRNGFYVTTNEYDLFGPVTCICFHAAQVYVFSKAALETGGPPSVTQFDTLGLVGGRPGFTLFPANSPSPADFSTAARGTEYFLSSMAAEEATGVRAGVHQDHRLALWTISNTASLATGHPQPVLDHSIVEVQRYVGPPRSNQKPGDFPLGQCVNDTGNSAFFQAFGFNCWQALFATQPAHNEVEALLDSSDSRVLSLVLADGRLFGTLDTAVNTGGQTKAGVAFYIIQPDSEDGNSNDQGSGDGRGARVTQQGRIALARNNVTYGAIGATSRGHAAIAVTVVGANHYPSAGYVTLDASHDASDVHIIAEGRGPSDGFTDYNAFLDSDQVLTPRWGDYGAAVAVGDTMWLGSEYIGQTCTLLQWAADTSCGLTRDIAANWYTHLTELDLSNPENR